MKKLLRFIFPTALPLMTIFVSSINTTYSLVYEYSFGKFSNPKGISIDPSGNIYVADTGDNLLKRYNIKGEETGEVGGYGWGNFQFDQPLDVCASNGVEIYVADYNNHRIQKFDRTLANVATLSTRNWSDESDKFGYPSGVVVSRLGDLFVCDDDNDRILKVNSFSTVERTFGGYGSGQASLTLPKQVDIGPDDQVYVTDRDRIATYDYFGGYTGSIGRGILHDPTGIGMDSDKFGVCDGDSLYFFGFDGKLLARFSNKDILGTTLNRFNDIAFYKDEVFILTNTKVVVAREVF